MFRNLKDLHSFEPFESNLETMKSASGKRHPGEKHNPLQTQEFNKESSKVSEIFAANFASFTLYHYVKVIVFLTDVLPESQS